MYGAGKWLPPSSKIVIDEEVDGANAYAIAIAAIAAKFTHVKQTKVVRRPRWVGAWLGTAAVVAGFDEMSSPRLARSVSAMRCQARRAPRARAMRMPSALERFV
jgi:hypothetical protein